MDQQTALLEVSMLNAEYMKKDSTDLTVQCLNMGMPAELVTRMEQVWATTKEIAGEIVQVGKIIVGKILEFIKANQNLSIGVAIGAAVSVVVGLIPFVGPLIAPLVAYVTVPTGAVVGTKLDGADRNVDSIPAAVFDTAKSFFKLIADIFTALKSYFAEK